MLFPIGAKHLEPAYLTRTSYMTPYAWTNIIVADMHNANSIAGIIGKSFKTDTFWNSITIHELKPHRKILIDESYHLAFYLPFLLP